MEIPGCNHQTKSPKIELTRAYRERRVSELIRGEGEEVWDQPLSRSHIYFGIDQINLSRWFRGGFPPWNRGDRLI